MVFERRDGNTSKLLMMIFTHMPCTSSWQLPAAVIQLGLVRAHGSFPSISGMSCQEMQVVFSTAAQVAQALVSVRIFDTA